MNAPIKRNATFVSTAAPFPENLPHRPLGTAAWLHFPDGHKPVWRKGDLWLGRLPDGGAPVGMRDDRHILVCAGPRSGKDASIVIPNLLMWAGSVVVIDPKGENAVVTARRRGRGSAYSEGMGQRVHILDPFDVVRTAHDDFADLKRRFNPLSLLRADSERSISRAALLAEAIVVSEEQGQDFWDQTARYSIQMVMLYVATCRKLRDHERHLGTVRKFLVAGDAEMRKRTEINAPPGQRVPSGLESLFAQMSENPAFGGIISRAGQRYANLLATSARTLASTFEVACTHTNFLDDPAMVRCLAHNDFDLSELKDSRDGVSLYLSLPQTEMHAQYRLLRMMITLITAEAEKSLVQPASGHPVLMVLNEFAGLRRMRVVEDAMAQIAGYGVKLMIVVQTLPQLKSVYKDNWETFVGSTGTRIFFGNDDHFTRDYVSKLIGEHEVMRRTVTFSSARGGSTNSTSSTGSSASSNVSESIATSHTAVPGGMSFSTTFTQGWTHGTSFTSSTSQSTGTNWSETNGWSESVHKRPLLTPDEVGRLFGDRSQPAAIVLMSGVQPLALARTRYFGDPAFAGRFDPHDAYALPMTLRQLAVHREREAKRLEDEKARREAAEWAEEEARRRAIAREAEDQRRKAAFERENDRIWRVNQKREFRKDMMNLAIRLIVFIVVLPLASYFAWQLGGLILAASAGALVICLWNIYKLILLMMYE